MAQCSCSWCGKSVEPNCFSVMGQPTCAGHSLEGIRDAIQEAMSSFLGKKEARKRDSQHFWSVALYPGPSIPKPWSTAKEAVAYAESASKTLDCRFAVCTDARNWVVFEKGVVVRVRLWDEFYTNEPSSEYYDILEAIGPYPK